MENPRIVLVGTRLSPPVELMRWLFERQSWAYQERVHAPAFHAWVSWWHEVPIELPLILTPQGAIGGLKDAIQFFDQACRPGDRVFGEDDEERAGNSALFEDLDQNLFRQAVRIYYAHLLSVPSVVVRAAVQRAPFWQSALVRLLFPIWRMVMRRGLNLNTFDLTADCAAIDGAFGRVAERLGDGREFLAGDRPGWMDIVFAALASPVLLPAQHPAKLPTLPELPEAFRRIVERYRETAAGRLALRTYERRSAPQPAMRVPKRERSLLGIIATPAVLRTVSRFLARFGPRRVSLKSSLFVFRWADVADVIGRDGDFRIAPVNAKRIEAVSGPFILGMDRSETLFAQRSAVYGALRADDVAVRSVLAAEPRRILSYAARRGRVDVVNGYARPIAARTAGAVFGIRAPTEQDLMRVARAVFHETFLNLGGDEKIATAGIAAGKELAEWIAAECGARRQSGVLGADVLGRLLIAEDGGHLTHDDVAHIAAGLLVGAIDTTATAVANIVAEILADPELTRATLRDLDNARRLQGWCWEALRRRPHNPLVVREAVAGAVAAGGPVAAGTRVFALTLSAMQDARVFASPARMDPLRPAALYMHFGYGIHACAGRNINAVQIPALVANLLRFAPSGPAKIKNRGPFPDELIVQLGHKR